MMGLILYKMALTAELKESWKDEKVNFHNEITLLKKSMVEYKVERKTEWKSFKNKFKDDMDILEKTVKKLSSNHKKQH